MNEATEDKVKKTPFIAIMVNQTTDISTTSQMSYVLRYAADGGVMRGSLSIMMSVRTCGWPGS